MPNASRAAMINYQYYNVTVATTLGGTYSVPTGSMLMGSESSYTLTIPVGDYVRVGLEGEASGADLNGGGIYSFGVGVTDSNANATAVYSTSTAVGTPLSTTVVPGGLYSFQISKGEYDGAGGVLASASGSMSGSYLVNQGNAVDYANGAGVYSSLINRLVFYAGGTGQSTFTPIQINSQTGFTTGTFPDATAPPPPSRNFNTLTDSYGTLPTLTIVTTTGVPEPTAAAIAGLSGVVLLKRRCGYASRI